MRAVGSGVAPSKGVAPRSFFRRASCHWFNAHCSGRESLVVAPSAAHPRPPVPPLQPSKASGWPLIARLDIRLRRQRATRCGGNHGGYAFLFKPRSPWSAHSSPSCGLWACSVIAHVDVLWRLAQVPRKWSIPNACRSWVSCRRADSFFRECVPVLLENSTDLRVAPSKRLDGHFREDATTKQRSSPSLDTIQNRPASYAEWNSSEEELRI